MSDEAIWTPQPGPQEKAIRAKFVDELLFGGAAGGGKSDYLLGDFAADIPQGKDWHGILFRHTYPELDELIRRSHDLYPQLGGIYKAGAHEWHFKSGAVLRLRHMENEFDFPRYQGHSFSWVAYDELCNWQNLKAYQMMKSRLRGPAQNKRIRASANPGGIGHQEVKSYFIDPAPEGTIIQGEQGMTRMFIRSLVTDNRILLENDPGYTDRLADMGDPELVKAWLEGDWEAIVGAFFTRWNPREAVVSSFEIPSHWPLFGAMDYGESAPTSFGLYTTDYDDNAYRICEYYASNRAASQHAYEIDKMIESCPFTNGRRPQIIYCDPSMFTKRRLNEAISHSPADVFAQQGLYLTRANNDRITGWRVVNDAIIKKRLYLFDGWNDNLMRTLPAAPRDKKNPEDIDTHCEDHALDELRYALVHIYRPATPEAKPDRNPFKGENVINELTKASPRHYGRYAL